MEALLPLASFAFVTSITPGPNNIMLTSSGVWFGFVRSIPHMLGITFGFAVLLAICAAGIGGLVVAVPAIHVLLKIAGSGYLLYLAWKLRSMSFNQDVRADVRPMSFVGAALFQFANPKAWVMAITGASAFLPLIQPVWLAIAIYCLVFSVVNLPCVSVWAGAGAVLRRYLTQPLWRAVFSGVMVALTIYSAVAIWL
ncbi:lysine transporter LysE [Herbaspirillum sp. meg3]|uniref:LysE family translocator n=1 Tax=Herbaspirillum sp. meg3 TaxID=2025949 RepID=UPI000B992311|nr:LysE family translocator [Herbaspirillum sp. meg3]ASU38181.1 lysine transporter LysE [Herbaspirillum sp. meg3]